MITTLTSARTTQTLASTMEEEAKAPTMTLATPTTMMKAQGLGRGGGLQHLLPLPLQLGFSLG
jgi:hypothetical protein